MVARATASAPLQPRAVRRGVSARHRTAGVPAGSDRSPRQRRPPVGGRWRRNDPPPPPGDAPTERGFLRAALQPAGAGSRPAAAGQFLPAAPKWLVLWRYGVRFACITDSLNGRAASARVRIGVRAQSRSSWGKCATENIAG